jgi:insertion element IS1 protein InsB
MSGDCLRWSHIYLRLCLPWSIKVGEKTDFGYGAQWQWGSGYSASFTYQSQYSHSGIKKKEPQLQQVNLQALKQLNPGQVQVGIYLVQPPEEPNELESELDEMWSYVGKKDNPRSLWHAIEHQSGKVLAYVFGRRKDEAFVQLKKLLEPFGISHFYTDGWGAYERHIEAQKHEIGKQNMQKIESKHINLRTRIKRLARKTICFSKTVVMHDIVIGLFINRSEFGMAI